MKPIRLWYSFYIKKSRF